MGIAHLCFGHAQSMGLHVNWERSREAGLLRILKPAPGGTALSSEAQRTMPMRLIFPTVCLNSTCRHPAGGHAGAEESTRAVVRRGNRPGAAICSRVLMQLEGSCAARTHVKPVCQLGLRVRQLLRLATICSRGPACGHRPVGCPRADAAASAAAAAAATPGGMPGTAPPQFLIRMTAPAKTGMTPVLHHTPQARATE